MGQQSICTGTLLASAKLKLKSIFGQSQGTGSGYLCGLHRSFQTVATSPPATTTARTSSLLVCVPKGIYLLQSEWRVSLAYPWLEQLASQHTLLSLRVC